MRFYECPNLESRCEARKARDECIRILRSNGFQVDGQMEIRRRLDSRWQWMLAYRVPGEPATALAGYEPVAGANPVRIPLVCGAERTDPTFEARGSLSIEEAMMLEASSRAMVP